MAQAGDKGYSVGAAVVQAFEKFATELYLRNPFFLDSESGFNWTANPELTGHPIRF
jgi:hypothetical protein